MYQLKNYAKMKSTSIMLKHDNQYHNPKVVRFCPISLKTCLKYVIQEKEIAWPEMTTLNYRRFQI